MPNYFQIGTVDSKNDFFSFFYIFYIGKTGPPQALKFFLIDQYTRTICAKLLFSKLSTSF